MGRVIKNRKGFVTFVVLTFTMISSLLGTGMYMISKQNSQNQAAYYQKTTSVEAAENGINWFTYMSQKHSDTLLPFLKNSCGKTLWYNGNGESWSWSPISKRPVKINDRQSAIFKLSNIDTIGWVLSLTTIANGINGSVKTVHTVIKIDGIRKLTYKTPNYDNLIKHALYIEGSMQAVNEYLDITGDFYSGGKTIFNDGSIVRGDTKIMNVSGQDVIINNNVDFEGSVYLDGNVTVNQGLSAKGDYFYVKGKTGLNNTTEFDSKTYLAGGFSNINGAMSFKQDAFIGGQKFNINKQVDAYSDFNVGTDVINFNDNLVLHGSDAKFIYDESKALDKGKIILEDGATVEMNQIVDVPSASDLSINDQREQEVTADYSNLTINFKLSDFAIQSGDPNFYNNNMRNSFNASFWEDLAEDGIASLNGKTFTAPNIDKNNGVLVVLVDEDIGSFSYGNFTKGNIVFIIENSTVNVSNNFWNVSSNDASIGFVVTESGKLDNLGGEGKFRGFVWDSSSNRGNYSSFKDGFEGTMLIKGYKNFNINNGPGTSMKITFDESAINPFASIGLFKDPSSSSTTSTFNANATRVTNIRMRILSKY